MTRRRALGARGVSDVRELRPDRHLSADLRAALLAELCGHLEPDPGGDPPPGSPGSRAWAASANSASTGM
ncbi:hypothetical protein ACSNOK_00215 [Streptomyces sp. URMC 126]|uniref:hypothetical protein n=1 Tax=Streptomyces sp. URMC 126 TaxID=3423401 RepID=UPI003F19D8BF